MMSYQGQFTVTNKVFQRDYRDPSSDDFRRLADEIETEVSQMMNNSTIPISYCTHTVCVLGYICCIQDCLVCSLCRTVQGTCNCIILGMCARLGRLGPALKTNNDYDWLSFGIPFCFQLNTLFRRSNLSSVYNSSTVLSLEPATAASAHERNMTSVSVLVQLNRPRPDGAVVIGTSFIEGMRNAHRRMWLGKRLTVKLDDISFSGEWSGTYTRLRGGGRRRKSICIVHICIVRCVSCR